ncbi:MAG: hypothetical protein A3C08_00625 [Candidatus Taylorbacteria bacterium RIFCSPHIGHO2_02_FULL_47_18]|uniref:DNA polymerase III delta N-terminal domain-containing protein n=1 Tax=Candidatus Taylorbacteria bacterium RIFCSPLOWO2_01_FULL_48_100 TaxID=1802322 RepID=A0A1G2NEQ1_9BACT|nr:MAG: hypothetical protein A2670_00655 [Candidatus Taylorbacteria bacterium RIFCSPHIGHO2_01_FULL_48_38]OHA27481.1 MAG: hypothetical protein A3C08_00625 [Candidatus Taylorbacteria bacterium RIFCSPHIGHO2_02_FULL_47_18]OHA34543.1 MAG: hypothetical protein A2938_03245 [Candidatus Taylorbacteria bacterium RIFCSPLOWO2_01_FULL_48_100]OHA40307.1 MAG: hypothetical protein A3J31_01720 [Candidatus Taylorbacteria bacterium RIFCSPLOWO2_02_FULL_48_16]OHA44968.1 MAG: hypothetical protein A3H13_03565 [Candid
MFYFFYGTDGVKARERASALVESLRKRKPQAEVFRIEAENWNPLQFDELIVGQGLFNKTYIVHIVSLFENEEAKEIFLQRISDVAASPNIFVAVEGEINKEELRAIAKHAEKVQEYKKDKSGKKKFEVFSLADALGARDKKSLWVGYQKAVIEGIAPENINGILSWKARSMLSARYPNRYWSTDELKNLSAQFVALYHDSHRGRHEFSIALERLILRI